MRSSLVPGRQQSDDLFRHEAFLYAGDDEFLEGTTAFIGEAVRAKEPIFVVVSARKIDLLRKWLKSDADKVQFADMDVVGSNPARIIPAWTEFVSTCGKGPSRGIGEPIWAGRRPTELVECQHHESLLNVGALRDMRTVGGDLRLVVTQPHVTKVLELTGLDKVFNIVSETAGAVTG